MSLDEKENKFEPPRHTKEADLPDVLYTKRDSFSIDISEVKDSFAWFVDMAEFLRTTKLKCRDCSQFPCHRYPKPDQKIGFCYSEVER